MKIYFSAEDRKKISGQASKLCKKHDCSQDYIMKIVRGEREANTSMAINIVIDLLQLLNFFNTKS